MGACEQNDGAANRPALGACVRSAQQQNSFVVQLQCVTMLAVSCSVSLAGPAAPFAVSDAGIPLSASRCQQHVGEEARGKEPQKPDVNEQTSELAG